MRKWVRLSYAYAVINPNAELSHSVIRQACIVKVHFVTNSISVFNYLKHKLISQIDHHYIVVTSIRLKTTSDFIDSSYTGK